MSRRTYGHEATCEVVSCEDLDRCQVGHGPGLLDQRGARHLLHELDEGLTVDGRRPYGQRAN